MVTTALDMSVGRGKNGDEKLTVKTLSPSNSASSMITILKQASVAPANTVRIGKGAKKSSPA